MCHAFQLADAVCVGGELQGVVVRPQIEIAAHSRCQVDNNIGFALPNTVDYLTVQLDVAAGFSRVGLTYVNMCNSGTGFRRLDRGCRNLRW